MCIYYISYAYMSNTMTVYVCNINIFTQSHVIMSITVWKYIICYDVHLYMCMYSSCNKI